jgi:hypothetical protein
MYARRAILSAAWDRGKPSGQQAQVIAQDAAIQRVTTASQAQNAIAAFAATAPSR